jgi:hypothetical protein
MKIDTTDLMNAQNSVKTTNLEKVQDLQGWFQK